MNDNYMQNISGKIAELESLRGIAALVVFLGHFTIAFVPQVLGFVPDDTTSPNIMGTPFYFTLNGSAAVALFFVLSGFVLSYSAFENPQISLVGSTIRRWPRLFPIALASVILSFILFKSGAYYHLGASQITKSSWLSQFGSAPQQIPETTTLMDAILQGAFFTFFRFGTDYWLNTSLWTMHLELVGSFIVFGIASILQGSSPKKAYFLFIIVGIICTYGDVFLPLFVAGTALAYFHSHYKFGLKKRSVILSIILIIPILTALSYMNPGRGIFKLVNYFGETGMSFRILMHGLASCAIIHLAIVDNNVNSFLNARIFRHLGRISFSLYVLHVPLLLSFTAWVFVYFTKSICYEFSVLFSLIITLPILYGSSYILTLADEKWCAYIKRLIPNEFTN